MPTLCSIFLLKSAYNRKQGSGDYFSQVRFNITILLVVFCEKNNHVLYHSFMYDLCSKANRVKISSVFSLGWLIKCTDSSLRRAVACSKMAARRLVSASRQQRSLRRLLFIMFMVHTVSHVCQNGPASHPDSIARRLVEWTCVAVRNWILPLHIFSKTK